MGRRYESAQGLPGEVVLATVSNPLENPEARCKLRPVVLVRRDGSRWHVMGLTTRTTYRNGMGRTPIPNPRAVGLERSGYLWGDKLTAIYVVDLDRHLGWVDADLAVAIIVQARLNPADRGALFSAVAGAKAA